jgi:hypothetical protein
MVAACDPLTLCMMKQSIPSVSSAVTKGPSCADADQTMLTALLNPRGRQVPGADHPKRR